MTSAKKTVQEKLDELDTLVKWFQGDDFQLEEAKTTLKKAAGLAEEIEKDLTSIANEITEVKKSFQSDSDT